MCFWRNLKISTRFSKNGRNAGAGRGHQGSVETRSTRKWPFYATCLLLRVLQLTLINCWSNPKGNYTGFYHLHIFAGSKTEHFPSKCAIFAQKSVQNLQKSAVSRTLPKLTFCKLHLKMYLGILGSSTSSMDAHTSTVMDIYALLYRPKKKFCQRGR